MQQMANYQKDGDTIQQKQHFSLNRDNDKFDPLLNRGCEACDVLKKHIDNDNIIRLISHNDADGISSAGIIANAIKEEGGQFHITMASVTCLDGCNFGLDPQTVRKKRFYPLLKS